MVDCAMFTSLFGCRYWYSPLAWPIASSARLAITSLAFMLVEVPAPPWIRSTTNCSWNSPRISRAQAVLIAACLCSGRWPSWRLASAAACLTMARATTSFG
ncbi:hypothetical protein D3C78_1148500 [compost metagenome]